MVKRTAFFGVAAAVVLLGATIAAGPQIMNAQQAQGTCPSTYFVVVGDTLYKIGARFNVWWTDIQVANNIQNPNLIFPGQRLTIPCPPGVTPVPAVATTPTPAPPAQAGPPAGCLISDGNACYGAGQTCSTEADWRRGKETCIFLGLGTNNEPDPPVEGPIIYAGSQLLVNGHLRGGYSNDRGHVCGMLIVVEGEPDQLVGVQVEVNGDEIGRRDAMDEARLRMRGLNVDCGGGYEKSFFVNHLGPRF